MLPRPHRHLASDKPTNVVAKKHRFRKAPNAHHSSPVMARPATRARRMMESNFSGISNNIASEYRAMCSVEIANARGVIHSCKEQMFARAALPCGANKSVNSGADSALPQCPWPSAATTTHAIVRAEIGGAGDALYNSAAIVGPADCIGTYRKVHLWGAENRSSLIVSHTGFPLAGPIYAEVNFSDARRQRVLNSFNRHCANVVLTSTRRCSARE
jgi:hypothetical protein